jgi:hypothetical protein
MAVLLINHHALNNMHQNNLTVLQCKWEKKLQVDEIAGLCSQITGTALQALENQNCVQMTDRKKAMTRGCALLPRKLSTYSCQKINSLFVWLVADGWCWFVLREKYCWLVADGWFVLREKNCWLVADKPSEQGATLMIRRISISAPTVHAGRFAWWRSGDRSQL